MNINGRVGSRTLTEVTTESTTSKLPLPTDLKGNSTNSLLFLLHTHPKLYRSLLPYLPFSMWRRAWKPAAAFTCVSAGTSYLYYTYKRPLVEIPVSVRGADGKREMTNKSFPLLSMSDVDARLREHVQDHTEARPNGLTWKHTTAFLPSNDPIEDANSHQIIQRDESDPAGPGDYLFFAVMDGHGGYDTSRLLSRTLIKAVALELSSLSSDPNNQSSGILQSLKSIIKAPAQALASRDDDPKQVSSAIQRAFVNFDSELLKAAPRVLAVNWDEDSRKKQIVPDLSKHPLALQTMLPAISGTLLCSSLLCSAVLHTQVAVL